MKGFADQVRELGHKKLARELSIYFDALEATFSFIQEERKNLDVSHFIKSFKHHKGTKKYKR